MKKTFTALLLLSLAGSIYAEPVAIVSAKSSNDGLDKKLISDIFLSKSTQFANGQTAVALEVKDEGLRNEFHEKYSGKTASQVKAYWAKLVFSGKAVPPKEVDAAEVKKLVADNPNMIGYIDKKDLDATVKVAEK